MTVGRAYPIWLSALLTCAGMIHAEAVPPSGFRLERVTAQAAVATTSTPERVVTAAFLPQEPRIDGDLSDWKTEPAFSMGAAQVYLGWTPRSLLLAAFVPDSTLVSTRHAEMTSTDAAIFLLGDAELFLSSSRGDRPVFRRTKFGQLDRVLFHRARGPEGTWVATRRQEDKGQIVYEAAIPWHTIADALPASSATLPFGFVLRDCRGEDVTDVSLAGTGAPATSIRLLLQPPPAPGIALKPSAARPVVGPGEDPEAYLNVCSAAPLHISSLTVTLDGQPEQQARAGGPGLGSPGSRIGLAPGEQASVRSGSPAAAGKPIWTGELAVQAGLISFRMRGLGLSPGRNRLTVAMPGLAPQELDIVVLDRAGATARLAAVSQQLGQWNRTQAPALVARSAASADYLAGEIAGLLERPRLSAMLAKRCLDDLESLEGVSRRLLGGKTAWDGQAGLLDCAHRSALDGTLQPYSLFVPAAPTPGTTRPLLVALPDINETPSLFLASPELRDAACKHGFMVLSPFGRGLGTSYRGPSEVDVSEALNEVLALFPVDRARIYVAGGETGGTAALELGLQSPDLFRGVGAVNAVGDELSAFAREWRKEPVAWLASLLESRSALPRARNAAGMALFLQSQPGGTGKALQDNLPRDLAEAGATLWDGKQVPAQTALPGLWEPMLTFFDANARPRPTGTVSFTSSRLSRNTAWWVRAETARVHGLDYAIRAERSSDGLFHVDLQNLTAFDLSVAGTALASGSKALLTVDGQSLEAQVPGDGWLRLRHAAESWSVAGSEPATTALRKRPGLEGPIEHAFMQPFLYVYSDTGPDAGVAERVARESARQWEQQYNGKVTVVPESKLTRKDEQDRNLVLFGFSGSSPRLASVLSAVPARIATTAIEIGQTSFNGRTLGLQMVRPNPAAPDRYVVAVTGNSPAGLELLSGHDWRKPDYLVVGPGYVEDTPQSALGGGFFDLKWQP